MHAIFESVAIFNYIFDPCTLFGWPELTRIQKPTSNFNPTYDTSLPDTQANAHICTAAASIKGWKIEHGKVTI